MSDSRKKPIKKDNIHIETKESTWRKFRRKTKQKLKEFFEDYESDVILPNKTKDVVNPYELNESIYDCRYDKDCYCIINFGFKKCEKK